MEVVHGCVIDMEVLKELWDQLSNKFIIRQCGGEQILT